MSISEQTLDTLEFPKIRERLARHTSFSASRDLALRLLPSTDAYVIRRRLQLTSESRRLLDERPDASIGGARDIRAAAGLARRGGVLDAAVFLEIGGTLRSGRLLRAMLLKQDTATFALLRELVRARAGQRGQGRHQKTDQKTRLDCRSCAHGFPLPCGPNDRHLLPYG
jgi:DNA mismatch repair protein MutS2